MAERNNLFWYGKKELTQDSTLMWILKNYKAEGFEEIAKDVLVYFAWGKKRSNEEKIEIEELRGKQQHQDIDVAVEFKLNGNWYYLVIEDKTYSYIHGEQIKKYLKSIFKSSNDENRPKIHIRMIYFKTTSFNQYDEEEPKVEAKAALSEYACQKDKNFIFDPENDVLNVGLKDFYEIVVSNHLNSSDFVLREYCLYMKDRYDALINNVKESDDISDFLIGYPDLWNDKIGEKEIERSNIFFASLFKEFTKNDKSSEFCWNQFEYFWFKHYRHKNEDQNLPIIEIRSRDFSKGKDGITIIGRLVNYTSYLWDLRDKDKEFYRTLTNTWTNYLKEKYTDSQICGFTYKTSSRKEDRMQLGTLTYEKKTCSMTYKELTEVMESFLKAQELIDNELEMLKPLEKAGEKAEK